MDAGSFYRILIEFIFCTSRVPVPGTLYCYDFEAGFDFFPRRLEGRQHLEGEGVSLRGRVARGMGRVSQRASKEGKTDPVLSLQFAVLAGFSARGVGKGAKVSGERKRARKPTPGRGTGRVKGAGKGKGEGTGKGKDEGEGARGLGLSILGAAERASLRAREAILGQLSELEDTKGLKSKEVKSAREAARLRAHLKYFGNKEGAQKVQVERVKGAMRVREGEGAAEGDEDDAFLASMF